MLIRSQDKELLLNMNYAKNISVCGKKKKYAVYVDYMYCVGDYSTKEKAIKVLNMIQEAYEKYEYEKVFKTEFASLETFQMPDDSEVEG